MTGRIKLVRGAPASMKSSMIALLCGSEITVTLLPLNWGSLNAVKIIGNWADTIERHIFLIACVYAEGKKPEERAVGVQEKE